MGLNSIGSSITLGQAAAVTLCSHGKIALRRSFVAHLERGGQIPSGKEGSLTPDRSTHQSIGFAPPSHRHLSEESQGRH